MPEITYGDATIQIEAKVLAEALRLDPDELLRQMREGTITSRLEHGEGENAGHVRLTFFSANRRIRMVADQSGNILSCGGVDVGRRPSPEAGRKAA